MDPPIMTPVSVAFNLLEDAKLEAIAEELVVKEEAMYDPIDYLLVIGSCRISLLNITCGCNNTL